jgi:predicted secreted protein
MTWTSIIAIYLLFWVMTAFVILPIGVRTHDELGLPKTPGQADSAPGNFQPRKILLGLRNVLGLLINFIMCT